MMHSNRNLGMFTQHYVANVGARRSIDPNLSVQLLSMQPNKYDHDTSTMEKRITYGRNTMPCTKCIAK